MAINWTIVGNQVANSVGDVVGSGWRNAAAGAAAQYAAIIAVGQQIESSRTSMRQAEYDSLKLMRQRALEGVLQTYEGISLDVTQQAAAAAWSVVTAALTAAYPALALVL